MINPAHFNRRETAIGLAAGVLGLSSHLAVAASRKQVTFVLVHGAWHGGWMWKNLAPLLRAAGHEVYAPTLTGMGERAHELNADVDLARHVEDIVQVLYYEDLHDVVLIGHSYGGCVITGVAEKATQRLAHVLYLDAFMPEDGKALQDYAPIPPRRADGWRIPSPSGSSDFVDDRIRDWARARFTDQPIKTFTQALAISPERTQGLKKSYIQTSTTNSFFNEAAARAKRNGFGFRAFAWNHEAVVEQSPPVAKLILELL